MAHTHRVYDTDGHFHINTDTRLVENVSSVIVNPVQYDHNSECMSFDMERYVDGHDMSTCDRVEIIFTNKGTEGTSKGRYIVDDLQISPDDENLVTFTWLIPQAATLYSGTLSFGVRFICTSEVGVLDYAWNTATYTGLTVSKGSGDASADEIIVYDSLQAGLNAADHSLLMARAALSTAQAALDSATTSEASAREVLASATAAEAAARAALDNATASEAAAREVLASIPEDYTALANDVAAVTSMRGVPVTDWEQGVIASASGADGASTTRCRSGYHRVSAGSGVSVSANGQQYIVYTYDSDTGYLGRLSDGWVTTDSASVVEYDGYIRMCVSYKDSATITPDDVAVTVELTSSIVAAVETVSATVDAHTAEIAQHRDALGIRNLFNPDAEDVGEKDTHLSEMQSGAEVWVNHTGYRESGYIPVIGGRGYIFYNVTKDAAASSTAVACYDKDKGLIKVMTKSNTDKVYILPDDAAYVRIAFKYTESFMFFEVTSDIELPAAGGYDYIPYGTTMSDVYHAAKVASAGHWAGKTWYAYGTSLTSETQGKYVPYVAELSGMTAVNKGIPGGALVANQDIYDALMSTDGKADADLITIEVGANDASTPIGDISSTDTSTFCGALNTCLQSIMATCPKAQIVLMPSTRGRYGATTGTDFALGEARTGGGTYEELHEAIRRVAVANGVYYIPFGSGLGLGLYRMQASDLYNVDNIHHSNLGGYNLAQGMWAYLQNIPLWYSTLPEAEA